MPSISRPRLARAPRQRTAERRPRLTCCAAAASSAVALKEWAPTCAALGAGEQTILLRKGGIKEPRFVPEAKVRPACSLIQRAPHVGAGPHPLAMPPHPIAALARPLHPTPNPQAFFLFPTSFHTSEPLLKPGIAERYAAEMALEPKQLESIPIAQYAEVTGAWTTEDERVLEVRLPVVCRRRCSGQLRRKPQWRLPIEPHACG
jgi:hypothetical protein